MRCIMAVCSQMTHELLWAVNLRSVVVFIVCRDQRSADCGSGGSQKPCRAAEAGVWPRFQLLPWSQRQHAEHRKHHLQTDCEFHVGRFQLYTWKAMEEVVWIMKRERAWGRLLHHCTLGRSWRWIEPPPILWLVQMTQQNSAKTRQCSAKTQKTVKIHNKTAKTRQNYDKNC